MDEDDEDVDDVVVVGVVITGSTVTGVLTRPEIKVAPEVVSVTVDVPLEMTGVLLTNGLECTRRKQDNLFPIHHFQIQYGLLPYLPQY